MNVIDPFGSVAEMSAPFGSRMRRLSAPSIGFRGYRHSDLGRRRPRNYTMPRARGQTLRKHRGSASRREVPAGLTRTLYYSGKPMSLTNVGNVKLSPEMDRRYLHTRRGAEFALRAIAAQRVCALSGDYTIIPYFEVHWVRAGRTGPEQMASILDGFTNLLAEAISIARLLTRNSADGQVAAVLTMKRRTSAAIKTRGVTCSSNCVSGLGPSADRCRRRPRINKWTTACMYRVHRPAGRHVLRMHQYRGYPTGGGFLGSLPSGRPRPYYRSYVREQLERPVCGGTDTVDASLGHCQQSDGDHTRDEPTTVGTCFGTGR